MNKLAIKAALLALPILVISGCAEGSPDITVSSRSTQTSTSPPYKRRDIGFYKGIAESRADAWESMAREADRLLDDGFNTMTLSPPVDIAARVGGQPRVILEGEAAAAEMLTDDFHKKNMAVFIAPTTRLPGFSEQVEPEPAALNHLEQDVLRWAEKAESNQAEIFSPLSRYNLVLGTEAAGKWSSQVLPQVKEKFRGLIAAQVVPDVEEMPAAGSPHDFEKLNYRGYDFIMLDIYPRGMSFDATQFEAYVNDVLSRAAAIAQRDELKGVMIGEFGGWRDESGTDPVDGPLLGATGQASMAARFLEIAIPRTRGVFYYGWTLPGRGAKGYPVEGEIKKAFNPGQTAGP